MNDVIIFFLTMLNFICYNNLQKKLAIFLHIFICQSQPIIQQVPRPSGNFLLHLWTDP